jgi:hypothetical protein
MPADPQTLIPQSAFQVTHNLEGMPGELRVHSVSDISVNFPPTSASSTTTRSGAENHQIRDPGKGQFPPVTLSCHGNKQDTKAVWDAFDKCGKGNPLRGAVTITILNPKDEYKPILEVHLHDNTLLSYQPISSGIDVDNPDTLSFEFTVSSDRMEFKKG